MSTDVRLSVDLGTTWTAAGVSTGGAPESVALGTDGAAMPSVVAVVDGAVVAGNAAVRAGAADPASSAREFKRRLGDTAPIVLHGTPYGAETLMGHLLGHVVATVTERVGAPSAVTLTHPAVFGEYKLDLLREAPRVAGLGSVSLLSEPEAAALHYARLGRLAVGDTVAVYDFGGGTFDAAVVQLEANGPRLLGRPEGLERLGGIDLDAAVLAHVDASLDGALSQVDTSDPDVRRAVLALRQECVGAKEALSVDTEVSVPVTIPGLNTVVRVTRAEFESFVRPRLGETLGALDRAIASANLATGDLAGVVLVGGSSRIPLVAEQVAAHTGRPLLTDADPKLVVVLGAVPLSDHPVAPEEAAMSTTTPPSSGSEPTAPADAPRDPADAAAAGKDTASTGGAKERRTSPGQREPEKGGLSTAGKIAAGVAAAGLAGATAAFWRDDLEEAVGLGDDGDDPAPPDPGVDPATVAAAEAVPETPAPVETEESMDAFDAVADAPPAARAAAGGAAPSAPAAPRPAAARAEQAEAPAAAFTAAPTATPGAAPRPAAAPTAGAPPTQTLGTQPGAPTMTPPPTTTTPPMNAPADPAFDAARAQLAERLETWQPPEGADPAEVAELRARLDGLLDRYEPRPGQSVDDAIADLRDQFELRIDNFTQDQKIDALVEEAAHGAGGSGGAGMPDPEFEMKRDALRESLASWEAPEGTTPEDAAALKAELQQLVDSFQPGAGQTPEQALAALQAQFDDQVHDFQQDQKIDALVDELNDVRTGDGMPAPDPEFEARRDTLRESLADWKAPEGTSPEDAAVLKAELESLVDQYRPDAGQTPDEAFAALRAEFEDQVQDFTQDQKIDALVDAQNAGDAAASTDPDEGGELHTQVEPIETAVLVDDFDEMAGVGDAPSTAAMPGFAIGEMDPTSWPVPAMDLGDVDVATAGNPNADDDLFDIGDLIKPVGGSMGGTVPDAVDPLDDPLVEVPEFDAAMAEVDERLSMSMDDLQPADDDMPSLVPDADDDLDLDLGGMTADDLDDPMSGI